MSYIPQFVSIYASHSSVEVKNDAKLLETVFGKPLQQLAAEPAFVRDQEFVRALKVEIEGNAVLSSTPDRALQVIESLKALTLTALYDDSPATTVLTKIDTMSGLLTSIYSGDWTPNQKAHFEFVAQRLRISYAYFLSYTNAGARIINDDYNAIIRKYADPVTRKARDRDTENMLPDAIVNWFERHKLRRGFYDKKRIEVGDFLKETIAPSVKGALTFIQLVHLDTFTMPQKVNWPYEEYKLFNDSTSETLAGHEAYRQVFESRLIPLIAGDPVKLKLPNEKLSNIEHRSWRDRIFDEALYLKLPMSKNDFDEAMDKLENAIVRRAYKIIESVPA